MMKKCSRRAALFLISGGGLFLRGMVTPLHPGAYKYYTEIGLNIPDNLKPVEWAIDSTCPQVNSAILSACGILINPCMYGGRYEAI